MSILSASCSFFSSKRCIIPGKQFLQKFHFIWNLMVILRLILLFLVRNDRSWSSLRCITLNARVYSLTLVLTSTGNVKIPPISLTSPKGLLKTSSEEWSCTRLVIILSYVTFPRAQQSSKYRNEKATGLFSSSILLKHEVSFTCRLKVKRSSDSAAGKI